MGCVFEPWYRQYLYYVGVIGDHAIPGNVNLTCLLMRAWLSLATLTVPQVPVVINAGFGARATGGATNALVYSGASHADTPVARPGAPGAAAATGAPGAIDAVAVAALFSVEAVKVVDGGKVVSGANDVATIAWRLGKGIAAFGNDEIFNRGQ